MEAMVLGNVFPYGPEETINFLVVTGERLSVAGTWMGDLLAGSEEVIHSLSPDGAKCLDEGTAD
jgi:hypothetical protein